MVYDAAILSDELVMTSSASPLEPLVSALGDGDPPGLRFISHVNHVGFTFSIEMSQFTHTTILNWKLGESDEHDRLAFP